MKKQLVVAIAALMVGVVYFFGVQAAGQVEAQTPALIAQITDASDSSFCCNTPPPASMTFCIGYDFTAFSGIGNPFASPLDISLGCGLSHPPGQTTVVDFDASNSPDFSAFVTRITNGVNDNISFCDMTLASDGTMTVPSSCSAGPESGFLSSTPDLTGYTIAYVRLIVNSVSVDTTAPDIFGNTQSSAAWDVTWQFYGNPTVLAVPKDFKPGSDSNDIQCKNSNGVISLAILTTSDFDAATVDHTTVTFEGASETHVDKKTGQPKRHAEDVDGDGDIDLLFHFRLGDTDLTCESTQATLTGETFDGQAIEATDIIHMVGG